MLFKLFSGCKLTCHIHFVLYMYLLSQLDIIDNILLLIYIVIEKMRSSLTCHMTQSFSSQSHLGMCTPLLLNNSNKGSPSCTSHLV
jgi:hypothetical protein